MNVLTQSPGKRVSRLMVAQKSEGKLLAAALVVSLLLTACSTAPMAMEKVASEKIANHPETSLGRSVAAHSAAHPGQSGHEVLDTGEQAFTARVALAGRSERTLDAQYYIWNADSTGRILAAQLLAAAERGVRVRLLMDDYGVGTKDKQLAALDAHGKIEVRVYNPFNVGFRTGVRRWGNFLFGFSRLNRRMHSKTFIADNSIAITGGRNIGDEYFDANPTFNYRDRDMLSAGPVVDEISSQFDTMWNNEHSVPIAALEETRMPETEVLEIRQHMEAALYKDYEALYALPRSPDEQKQLLRSMLDNTVWAPTSFVYNPPAITDGDESHSAVVGDKLLQLMSRADSEVLIESAYFTVMDDMLALLPSYLDSGVKVKVLTNSLATTDVWTIHAGYTRNRAALLKLGLELHEWRDDAESCSSMIDNDKIHCDDFLYSLHAKTVAFDREIVFVGSFNLNPRSHLLNTETALVIESRELAQRIGSDISLDMQPENAWRLSFSDSGKDDSDIRWQGTVRGSPEIYDQEPKASTMVRFKSWSAAWLPLEKYW